MDNFDIKKFLGEKSLLNESAPGYDTRKMGEPLPTLESVKAAHEAKEGKLKENDRNEYANSEEDYTDKMVMEKIKDIIRYHELDPSEVMEEVGQEFGVAFEFGRE